MKSPDTMTAAERVSEIVDLTDGMRDGLTRVRELLAADWRGVPASFLREFNGVDDCRTYFDPLEPLMDSAVDAATRLDAMEIDTAVDAANEEVAEEAAEEAADEATK